MDIINTAMSYATPGIAWLLFLSLILIYELVAIATGNYTLSAFVWHITYYHPWIKWVVLAGTAFLNYHFFFMGNIKP